MDFKFILGILAAIVALGAGAAMVRWPFNLLAETVLCGSIFSGLVVVGGALVGVIDRSKHPRFKMAAVLVLGIIAGAYLAESFTYFLGYLANTYPISQKLISEQRNQINDLTAKLDVVVTQNRSLQSSLDDATKVLEDPLSVPKPSYTLETSLRLQFNGTGEAKEIDSKNISWSTASIEESHETAVARPTPSPVDLPSTPSSDTSSCTSTNLIGGKCGYIPSTGIVLPLGIEPQCPKMECPEIPQYETVTEKLLFLNFLHPIAVQDIHIDSYGAEMPKYKIIRKDNYGVTILFLGTPKNVAIMLAASQENAGHR